MTSSQGIAMQCRQSTSSGATLAEHCRGGAGLRWVGKGKEKGSNYLYTSEVILILHHIIFTPKRKEYRALVILKWFLIEVAWRHPKEK